MALVADFCSKTIKKKGFVINQETVAIQGFIKFEANSVLTLRMA